MDFADFTAAEASLNDLIKEYQNYEVPLEWLISNWLIIR
jgi:hypothetical protein